MRRPSTSQRLARLLPPLGALLLVAYFGFHATYGDRGFLAHEAMRAKTAEREAVLAGLKAEQEALARRVDLIGGAGIDADLLEEEVRRALGWSRPDEIIVLQPGR